MDADGLTPPPGKSSRRVLSPRPGSGVNPPPFSARAFSRGLRKKPESGRPMRDSGASFRGPVRRRVKAAPDFWQNLCPLLAGGSTHASGRPEYEDSRVNLWLLVLEAKKIPHVLVPKDRTPPRGAVGQMPGFEAAIYVPPLHVQAAVADILAVEAERSARPHIVPARQSLPGILVFFVLLALWHLYRWDYFHPSSSGAASLFPTEPSGWASAFGLDVYRFRVLHEYWRTATALTLHANDSHLFGNAAFGVFLFFSLCRRTGLGLGLLLGVMGGVLGNAANACFRPAGFLSTGFSTAVFAALGALCCVTCADIVRFRKKNARCAGGPGNTGAVAGGFATTVLLYLRPALAPLAAGLALLGLLGGGGEIATDYGAHIWGFFGGVVCAFAARPLLLRADELAERTYALWQIALFTLTLALLIAAWCHALLWGVR
ncbi:rhomboid family intramembrane serine protease [Desulfovibrio sp. OttesenSCG-928-G15]|nr:rhomboid family intramembrane serine protease [Desulfovibrio sp. OttesenSCG-928-G15]